MLYKFYVFKRMSKIKRNIYKTNKILTDICLGSVEVIIEPCRGSDPGSIPGQGAYFELVAQPGRASDF